MRRPCPTRSQAARAQADPEPARHIREFRVRRVVQAAQVQAPAPCRRSGRRRGRPGGLPDASGRCRWCLPAHPPAAPWTCRDMLRRSGEFGSAAGRAEMIGRAAVIEAMLAGLRIDRHATDGIENLRRAAGGRSWCARDDARARHGHVPSQLPHRSNELIDAAVGCRLLLAPQPQPSILRICLPCCVHRELRNPLATYTL